MDTLISQKSECEVMDTGAMIRFGLRFVHRAAGRIVKLTPKDWERAEKLLQSFINATEEEKPEIVDAIAELLFPEETIGGVIDARESTSVESRQRIADYRKKVGEQIQKNRRKQRLTQQQLAKKTGLPQSHISRLEAGRYAPTEATIKRIAKALKTTPSQLDPGFSDDN